MDVIFMHLGETLLLIYIFLVVGANTIKAFNVIHVKPSPFIEIPSDL